jgi:hypothetical protein
LPYLVFRVKLAFKDLKEIRVTRVIRDHRDQKVIKVRLVPRESVESLVRAEKAMTRHLDSIQVGHITKTK